MKILIVSLVIAVSNFAFAANPQGMTCSAKAGYDGGTGFIHTSDVRLVEKFIPSSFYSSEKSDHVTVYKTQLEWYEKDKDAVTWTLKATIPSEYHIGGFIGNGGGMGYRFSHSNIGAITVSTSIISGQHGMFQEPEATFTESLAPGTTGTGVGTVFAEGRCSIPASRFAMEDGQQKAKY